MMSRFVLFLALVAMPMVMSADKKEVTKVEDVCTFDCMQDLYAEFCGGATCVHSVDNEKEKEAMCSDKCLDVIFGKAANACLAKNLPEGADTEDFIDFLKQGIYDFCYDGVLPPEEAVSSEEAAEALEFEARALDLVDGDY